MAFSGLTLRDLEYVVAVEEAGSFTGAAERCSVSQPSLSVQVRKVEDQLGLAIFERAGRQIRTTSGGRLVIEQARIVLAEARHLVEVARNTVDPLAGMIRLGAIATLGPYLIPHLLGPLRRRLPKLQPIFKEGLTADLVREVHSGNLDAVLLSPPVEGGRLTVREVFFEPFLVICPTDSDLARRDPLALDDLEGDGLLLMDEGHCLTGQVLSLCRSAGRRASERHAASLETLRHLVAAGAGYSIIPALAVHSDPRVDHLIRYRPFGEARVGRIVGLAWRQTDPRAEALCAFAEFIRMIGIPGVRSV